MRLWSVSFKYLDAKGLLAVWREGLLAKNVLEGKTKGYKNHPQLQRFKNSKNPILMINVYLHFIVDEAEKRNYNFNREKLLKRSKTFDEIFVNDKLVEYEFSHLMKKLKIRDERRFENLISIKKIEVNFTFKIRKGEIENWEII